MVASKGLTTFIVDCLIKYGSRTGQAASFVSPTGITISQFISSSHKGTRKVGNVPPNTRVSEEKEVERRTEILYKLEWSSLSRLSADTGRASFSRADEEEFGEQSFSYTIGESYFEGAKDDESEEWSQRGVCFAHHESSSILSIYWRFDGLGGGGGRSRRKGNGCPTEVVESKQVKRSEFSEVLCSSWIGGETMKESVKGMNIEEPELLPPRGFTEEE
ncbi:hypothetical protein Tco_1003544 [Tanacetum coccineum]|uniref:Uncharacterized protein n=1 Tax=Tanacetum coccineum TaxID=301880 RepID=A0ABQ5F9R4_9ASTR